MYIYISIYVYIYKYTLTLYNLTVCKILGLHMTILDQISEPSTGWLQPPSCSFEWHDLRVERLVERRARWSSFEDFQSCQLASKTGGKVSSWCSQRELTAGTPQNKEVWFRWNISFRDDFQLVVNCWFGARWFGFLESLHERECYIEVARFGSQTTGPQTNN